MNCVNVYMFQNGEAVPPFISRSRGLSMSASANLRDAPRTNNPASSIRETDACRRRHGNSRPGRKKSFSGIARSSTMRTRPRATMPFWCDMRVRVLKLLNAISAMQKARRPASCSPTHQGLVVVMAALPLFGVLVRTRYTAWPATIMAQSRGTKFLQVSGGCPEDSGGLGPRERRARFVVERTARMTPPSAEQPTWLATFLAGGSLRCGERLAQPIFQIGTINWTYRGPRAHN